MMEKQNIYTDKKIAQYGFLFGLAFPVMAWAFEFLRQSVLPTFGGIAEIHITNPILFIIDTAPVVLSYGARILSTLVGKRAISLETIVAKKDEEIGLVSTYVDSMASGDYEAEITVVNEGELASKLLNLNNTLKNNKERDQVENWKSVGRENISVVLRNATKLDDIAYGVVKAFVDYVGAVQGAFYVSHGSGGTIKELRENVHIDLVASYAYKRQKYIKSSYKLGEGLVGEAAIEKLIVHRIEIPEDYLSITSGILGDKKPEAILVVPLVTEDELQGVLEIAGFEKFSSRVLELAEEIGSIVARTLYNVKTTEHTEKLLDESLHQTKQLEEQQSVIASTNSKLEEQIDEVHNAQQRLNALLENASEVITIFDESGKVLFDSPSINSILDYEPEELIGDTKLIRVHPDYRKTLQDSLKSLIENPNEVIQEQLIFKKKSGEDIWVEITGRNLLKNSSINGLVINTVDITERRLAEQEQIMRGKMQALSENSKDIILRFDLDGVFLYANPMLSFYTGISQELVLDKQMELVGLDWEVVNVWKSVIEEIRETKQPQHTEASFSFDEKTFVMAINAIPEFDQSGELDTVLMVSHDITERKKQALLLENTNKKITDSINYARRIQDAIIPDKNYIKEHFPNFLMFYKPKDVVSGDFPFFMEHNGKLYCAAVDCTGHGVPGAMMSLIGYLLLRDIIGSRDEVSPAVILDELHRKVVETLNQDDPNNKAADGMDVAIITVDKKTNVIEFSGAHRPLYHITDGELVQYKGDKYPVGGTQYRNRQNFENTSFVAKTGDSILFFSDGLPDQFGGPEDLKFGPKRIRNIFTENQYSNMEALESTYENAFEDWRGDSKQMDDVLVMGIKF